MKELVTVVIPILDTTLSPLEEMALHHSIEVLRKHTVIFVSAAGTDLSIVKEYLNDFDVINFPDQYFKSRNDFGQLLMMEDFFERFNWASYLLVHELNSWIVKDELTYWCNQGYDFLKAAPVFESKEKESSLSNTFSRIKGLSELQKRELGDAYFENGFGLYYIEAMSNVLKSKKKLAYQYRHDQSLNNADAVFWEVEPNRFIPKLRKPTRVVQQYFARHINSIENLSALKREQLPFAITGVTSIKGITSEIVHELPYFS